MSGKQCRPWSDCILWHLILGYTVCSSLSVLGWLGEAKVSYCRVSYATGASNWYWLTFGQGLLSFQLVRVAGDVIISSVSSLSFIFHFLLSLSFISSTISSNTFAGLGGSVDVRPTGDQEVAGSTPAKVGNILSWRLIMKYFLRSFSPFRWFKKGSCQFLAKECAQYWSTA